MNVSHPAAEPAGMAVIWWRCWPTIAAQASAELTKPVLWQCVEVAP